MIKIKMFTVVHFMWLKLKSWCSWQKGSVRVQSEKSCSQSIKANLRGQQSQVKRLKIKEARRNVGKELKGPDLDWSGKKSRWRKKAKTAKVWKRRNLGHGTALVIRISSQSHCKISCSRNVIAVSSFSVFMIF